MNRWARGHPARSGMILHRAAWLRAAAKMAALRAYATAPGSWSQCAFACWMWKLSMNRHWQRPLAGCRLSAPTTANGRCLYEKPAPIHFDVGCSVFNAKYLEILFLEDVECSILRFVASLLLRFARAQGS